MSRGGIEGVFSSITVEIESNDTPPVSFSSVDLFYEDFENGSRGWIVIPLRPSSNRWRTGNMHALDGNRSAYVSNSNYSGVYNTADDADVLLVSPPIDASMLQDEELWLSFLYLVGGDAQDFGEVGIVDANVTTYSPLKSGYHTTWTAAPEKIRLPDHLKGGLFRIAFRWVNDATGGTPPAMVVDQVKVEALRMGMPVASEVSQMPEANRFYLGPYDEVYFYDSLPGGLICRIENLEEHDYGCTQVYIDETDNPFAHPFYTDSTTATIAKNVHIVPAQNNTQGPYRLRMYYTTQEVERWQNRTGKVFDELMLIKTATPLSEADASTAYEMAQDIERGRFGENYWVEGTFTTGFSGFSGGNFFMPMNAIDIHLEAQSDRHENTAQLQWEVEGEASIERWEVERMAGNDTSFTVVQTLPASARTFVDSNVPDGKVMYRVRAILTSGQHITARPVELYIVEENAPVFALTPNPIESHTRLVAKGAGNGIYRLQLRNLRGDVLWTGTWEVKQTGDSLPLTVFESLPSGAYVIELLHTSENKRYFVKALKN